MFKNLRTETHAPKPHTAELAAKERSGFHFKRNVVFKLIQIEPLDYHVWKDVKR